MIIILIYIGELCIVESLLEVLAFIVIWGVLKNLIGDVYYIASTEHNWWFNNDKIIFGIILVPHASRRV